MCVPSVLHVHTVCQTSNGVFFARFRTTGASFSGQRQKCSSPVTGDCSRAESSFCFAARTIHGLKSMLRRTSVYIDPRYICRFRPCYRYSANSRAVQRSETQEFADTIAAVIVLSDQRAPRLVFFAFLLVSSTFLYIRSN